MVPLGTARLVLASSLSINWSQCSSLVPLHQALRHGPGEDEDRIAGLILSRAQSSNEVLDFDTIKFAVGERTIGILWRQHVPFNFEGYMLPAQNSDRPLSHGDFGSIKDKHFI
jgi:hypothetical protein